MRCPHCKAEETRVMETRTTEEGQVVRRRRECPSCMKRFTTYERAAAGRVLLVIKKNGTREPFDLQKLLTGFSKACEKLPVPYDSIEDAAARVEEALRGEGAGEVASQHIGELAVEELRQLNKVAYVRFASVYRQFGDLADFSEVLRLLEEKAGEESPGKTP